MFGGFGYFYLEDILGVEMLYIFFVNEKKLNCDCCLVQEICVIKEVLVDKEFCFSNLVLYLGLEGLKNFVGIEVLKVL